MRRYVIIGGGAAGIAAAEAIREQDGQGEIILLNEDRFGYYSRPGLAYYLTGELPEELLFPFREEDYRRLELRRLAGRAVRVDTQAYTVLYQPQAASAAPGASASPGAQSAPATRPMQALPYDSLLIATGAEAVPLKTAGAERPGVVKLDSLADAQVILKLARKARTAVVVGGGITALELVEGLLHQRVKVHYLLRGERYWSNVLDESEARLVESRLREHGVVLHYNTEITEITGKAPGGWLGGKSTSAGPGAVRAVRLKDGQEIACDLVGYAIGVRPRKALAEAAGLRCERGILVDEGLRSSAPDVYAAGDVAQVYDPRSKRSVVDSLWGPARAQGTVAGVNMAGGSRAYRKPAPFNVTRLADLTTTIIGSVGSGEDLDLDGKLAIARGDSETWRQLPDAIAAQAGFEVNRLRVLVGERTLLGAVVMGDQTLSRSLQQIVAEQVDISAIRGALVAGERPLADVLAEFWTESSKTAT